MLMTLGVLGVFALLVVPVVLAGYLTRPVPATCGTCGAAASTHTTDGMPLCPRCAARWWPR